MPTITVFTPTYNRGHLLPILFETLKKQSFKDFEWVIVDDGSTDNTWHIVNQFKQEVSFDIVYLFKRNEGKHIAINEGVKIAKGEWFFIVDSDDYLAPNALERIIFYCRQIDNKKDFAGVVGLRGHTNGVAWTGWYQNEGKTSFLLKEYIDATSIEYTYKLKIQGDRAEVIRTEILKEYPFPKFDNEKFLVESYLWLSLAKAGYIFRWFNEIIYFTEYLDDGLTKNIIKHYEDSPIGSMSVANLRLSCSGIPTKVKLKSSYQYFKYGKIAGISLFQLCREIKNKTYIIPGVIFSGLMGRGRFR